MRQIAFRFIIFTVALILLVPDLAAAELTEDAGKIPDQVSHSDRIVIGTVSQIDTYYNYTIYTITITEWLYNPLNTETIKVKTEIGTNFWTEDEAEFTQNESALLMLRDKDSNKQLFSVTFGSPGKRPVSDRNRVIEELKVQGKWQNKNQTVNDTENIRMAETTGADGGQEENPSSNQKPNQIPLIRPIWTLSALLGAVTYISRR
jgi:hypothetical protein